MSVLLLRLAAPLQAWGTSSRFVRRNTDRAPSRSGIIGLLAAADGRRRTDPIEDLCRLEIGVRVEQPGQLERDFQTARPVDGGSPMPLSYRFYIADAVFLAGITGDPALLEGLRQALRAPEFPLYLGRRSCPPSGPLVLGLHQGTLDEVLRNEPWRASPAVQRAHRGPTAELDLVMDCPLDTPGAVPVRDEPVSFDPRHRRYEWRSVLRSPVLVHNPHHVAPAADTHDAMALLGELT